MQVTRMCKNILLKGAKLQICQVSIPQYPMITNDFTLAPTLKEISAIFTTEYKIFKTPSVLARRGKKEKNFMTMKFLQNPPAIIPSQRVCEGSPSDFLSSSSGACENYSENPRVRSMFPCFLGFLLRKTVWFADSSWQLVFFFVMFAMYF